MKDIAPYIDFKDSSFRSCEMNTNELIVYLNSWDDKTLKVVFLNPIEFMYRGGDVVDGVYEVSGESKFLKDSLATYYEEIPTEHPFKTFEILDISNSPIFQIVAEDVNVSKE